MQRLPTGDWWTSLNSDLTQQSESLKDLPTAHAELVVILPTPSVSSKSGIQEVTTIGSYAPKKPPGHKPKLPSSRHVSCGSFLDYGPYASFAPTFDQEGREIGRAQLGEVYSVWEERKRRRELAGVRSRSVAEVDREGDVIEVDQAQAGSEDEGDKSAEESMKAFSSTIEDALGTLELDSAIQELLKRISSALERLEFLQVKRLSAEGGGTSTVEVNSEEWDTG